MGQLVKYPRGFTARTTPFTPGYVEPDNVQHDVIDISAHSGVDMLYNLYMTRGTNAEKWHFRRRVIHQCKHVFGDFKDWLTLQTARNDNIYGLNLAFIIDTVQFIRTGRRDMRVMSWNELLLEYPTAHIGCATRRRFDELQISDPMEFDNFIGMWCAQPGGLEDMLWTAHVLFGSAKVPARNVP